MDEKIILAVLAILAVLVLAVIIRYRHTSEAEFSIRDWLKFRFKGSNKANETNPSELGVKLEEGSQLTAHEVVGRDKITNIYGDVPKSTKPSQLPELTLKLYKGDDGAPDDGISFETHRALPQVHIFGFELENATESTLAKGIGISVEFSWRGAPPQTCPRIEVPLRLKNHGWAERRSRVGKDGQPAVLTFKDTNLTCPYGIPISWNNFKVHLSEHMKGYLLVQYKLSGDDPQTYNSEELIITLASG